MSLLLQALQRAAKSREGTGQEPDAGAGARLELEPQPRVTGDAGVEGTTAIDLDDIDTVAPRRSATTTAPPPYLSAGTEYGGPSLMDHVRERPVVAFGGLALLFAVSYGIYLYVQIFHPQWLRGDFSRPSAILTANPPPASPPDNTSSPYSLPPATNYPANTGQTSAGAPGFPAPSATGLPPTAANGPTASGTQLSAAGGTAPMPLPGSATAGSPTLSAQQNVVMQQSPASQQNSELASLMNLPSKQPARPAPGEAPSRLSTLGDALSDGPRAVPPARPLAPSSQLSEPPTARPTQPTTVAPPPAIAQPAPRPRNAPTARPNLAAAKPLTSAPSGSNVIELKDQVVINAAPTQQIESSTVADAYRSWRAGRLDQARDIYRDVLENEPRNVDALLGLAGIAQQQGNAQEALSYFGRALEADPRNSSAQAGIIAITGQSDPNASEARLKQLITREPSAFLHFTLGNLYARQNQWAQAQQSYFQAFSMNADNSDYAYNLAVSLEHIGQEKLAITYYRKAVDLSLKQGGRASFNQEQVIDRITRLSLRAK